MILFEKNGTNNPFLFFAILSVRKIYNLYNGRGANTLLLFFFLIHNYKNTKEEYQMDSNKLLKIASVVTTVLGLGVSLVTSMLEEKKMDAMVSEKVAEAVKKAMEVK